MTEKAGLLACHSLPINIRHAPEHLPILINLRNRPIGPLLLSLSLKL